MEFDWPGSLDLVATSLLLGVFLLLPALGYFFLVMDFRRYLRSLRRALVVVGRVWPRMPSWAGKYTPHCLSIFGLRCPCTEEDLKQAYRERVKEVHPDRGGDPKHFQQLQQHFERGLEFLRK